MDQRLVDEFRRAVGPEAVLTEPVQLVTYECDALPHLRSMPELVLLPRSAADVQAIVRICNKAGVPFVARGHGTGLSGGALPVPGGVVISLAKLNRVLDVDIPNRRVTVEPGVTNLEITRQVAPVDEARRGRPNGGGAVGCLDICRCSDMQPVCAATRQHQRQASDAVLICLDAACNRQFVDRSPDNARLAIRPRLFAALPCSAVNLDA